MTNDPSNIPRPGHRRFRAIGRNVAVVVTLAVGYLSMWSCAGGDTDPVTFDSCAEADSEAAYWQRHSLKAEADMVTYEYDIPDGHRYEHAVDLFERAMVMQSRIIAGNQACFPAATVTQAASHINVPLADLPAGPSE